MDNQMIYGIETPEGTIQIEVVESLAVEEGSNEDIDSTDLAKYDDGRKYISKGGDEKKIKTAVLKFQTISEQIKNVGNNIYASIS